MSDFTSLSQRLQSPTSTPLGDTTARTSRSQDPVPDSSQIHVQRWQTRSPLYPQHGDLARPQSAVVRDCFRNYKPQDRRTTSLVSNTQSLPSPLVSHRHESSSRSQGRSSVSPQNAPESTVVEGHKLVHGNAHARQDAGSEYLFSHPHSATPSHMAASNYAMSIASSVKGTPTTRQTVRSLVSESEVGIHRNS